MIGAYKDGKDLYATVACNVFNNTYWDNMEHHEDGSPNPEGKKRRGFCKSILLGIMYGRGAAAIAEQTGSSVEEAQKIINNFYSGFPKVKEWVKKTEEDAKKTGYVEDFWGRRRRLPDLLLPKYTVKLQNTTTVLDFNPLFNTKGLVSSVKDNRIEKYTNLINNARGYKDRDCVKSEALKDGVVIIDNGAFISQAERQCVNARIQGSASTMTKIAMKKIYSDAILNELNFKLLITVHDELIGECPVENADEVSKRLSYIMSTCIQEYTDMPFKCDAETEPCWYLNTYQHDLVNELSELAHQYGEEEAFIKFRETHTECTPEELQENINLYLSEKR